MREFFKKMPGWHEATILPETSMVKRVRGWTFYAHNSGDR